MQGDSGLRSRWPFRRGAGGGAAAGPTSHPEIADQAAAELGQLADQFEGLYLALRLAAADQLSGERVQEVVLAWQSRLRHHGAIALLARWDQLRQQVVSQGGQPAENWRRLATSWYQQLTAWGLRADERQELPVDETVQACYRLGEGLAPGCLAKVQAPCWWVGQQLIERGWLQVSSASVEGANR